MIDAMKKISNRQFAEALYQITSGLKGEVLDKVLHEFVLLLSRNRRIKRSEKVLAEFVKYSKKQAGILEMNIISTRKLEKNTLELIDKAFNGKTEITEEQDKTIIGGIKIKTDDKIFDASIKKQLIILKNNLTK